MKRKSALAIAGAVWLLCGPAQAQVSGVCSNCHTMHNSQNAQPVSDRGDVAFDPGDVDNYQVVNLLVNACIGCHSSAGTDTIVNVGSTRIPIVYNTVEPSHPLAAGNFFYVENRGDEFGHNVRSEDSHLTQAPGNTVYGCGFEGCHFSLASIRYGPGPTPLFNPVIGNGCIGCHNPAHHANDRQLVLAGGAKYVDESGGGYRFLNKAGANFWDIPPHNNPGVAGIEDPDWEFAPAAASHNEYQDNPKPFAPGAYGGRPEGISDFCSGCHIDFHSWPAGGSPNGTTSPWLRHPAGVTLRADGEYAGYTTYDPAVPVARKDHTTLSSAAGPSQAVTPGEDKVMCLSCHRAHASPHKDMLRWEYSDMAIDSGRTHGCFRCHTTKN
ncbi:MAG: cytochrome c3 family protein [Thermodesulfobacteriota bacterium]